MLMNKQTTPTTISDAIIAFCRDIDSTQKPVYVSVKPVSGAVLNECFSSVRDYINQHYGGIKFGWIIWELPGIFLEAEFHAVWISPSHELVDITPKADNENAILFLPDSKRAYEDRLIENLRKPLIVNADTLRWLRDGHALFLIKQKHFRNGKVDVIAAQKEFEEWANLPGNADPPKIGRNDRCLCGSGKKFKHCCGLLPNK
jgi:hypothetical protein